jgi:hypothetical protein
MHVFSKKVIKKAGDGEAGKPTLSPAHHFPPSLADKGSELLLSVGGLS